MTQGLFGLGMLITRRMDNWLLGSAGIRKDVSGELIEGALGAARLAR